MRYFMLILTLLTFGCTYEHNYGEEDMSERITTNKRGWSASGALRALDRLKEVSLQANFDENPTNYTAQFKLLGNLEGKVVEAEVTWSVEGNQIRRLISVSDGVSIQGTAQGVSIKIRDVSPLAVPVLDYTAFVAVVPGTRGSTSNPPFYKPNPAYAIAAAGTQLVAVPQNAGVISFRTTLGLYSAGVGPIVQDSVRVSQIDSVGNVQAITDAASNAWTPLAPNTTRLLIENMHSDIVAVGVYWGIDG